MSEWISPTPREEMLARVVQRGRKIRLIRRVVVGATAAGVVAAGAAGYAAGASDSIDLGGGKVLPDATASYHACPGSGPVGEVHRGDRVLLTGVSEDGSWYEIRSPFQLLDRVWIPASVVTPDAEVDLPEASCGLTEDELILASGEVLETTTTVPEEESTTTTEPEVTTTVPGQVTIPTQPPVTQPPTPTTKPPTPTTKPDTTPPVINPKDIKVNRTLFGEAGQNAVGCPVSFPRDVTVTAIVSDGQSSVKRVRLHWVIVQQQQQIASGTVDMSKVAVDQWRHVLSFPEDTLSFASPDATVHLAVSGQSDGGTAGPVSSTQTLKLRDCTFG